MKKSEDICSHHIKQIISQFDHTVHNLSRNEMKILVDWLDINS